MLAGPVRTGMPAASASAAGASPGATTAAPAGSQETSRRPGRPPPAQRPRRPPSSSWNPRVGFRRPAAFRRGSWL